MSSYLAKTGELTPDWHVVDATDKVLGRMATELATILQGKHKPTYTPHVDTGDFVIVLNASKVKVTGRKAESRTYQTYSGYPSGQHVYSYKAMNEKSPEKVIELAVRRMLPKSKLGKQMLSKLKVYAGDTHTHQAQQPKPLAI
ncbi:MAG: 50S ribosomal protein L13 [Planctomycetota bacterium]